MTERLRERLRVATLGCYAHRQPLAYAPIRERCAPAIEVVDDPSAADLLVVAHTKDFDSHCQSLSRLMAARPGRRLVLLSEEPFWDTVWGANPFARWQDYASRVAFLSFVAINHQTSQAFAFERIPYFLLTDPRYINHYKPLFARNAGLSAADWRRHFHAVEWDAAFVAVRRRDRRYDVTFSEHDVQGLCRYRSTLAERAGGASVLRMGEGWAAGPPRQALADWHAEKLALLDMKCRYVSGLENTHQASYVSEKIVDAFAVGAVPLYFAGSDHRVTRLAPPGSWINVYGRSSEDAFDAAAEPPSEVLDAYVEAQRGLDRLFSDPAAVGAELDRFAAALVAEFHSIAG